MKKFCAKCGAQIQEDVKFCPKCGAKIQERNQEERQANRKMTIEKKVKKQRSKLGIIITIALFLILGVSVAIMKTQNFSIGTPAYEQPIKEYVEAVNNGDEKLLEDAIVEGYWMNYKPNFIEYGRDNLQYSIKNVESVDLNECQGETFYFRNKEITDGKLLTIDFGDADGVKSEWQVYVFKTGDKWYLNNPIKC